MYENQNGRYDGGYDRQYAQPRDGYAYGTLNGQPYGAAYDQPALSYNQYLARTFGWMAVGLFVTFAVAFATAFTSLIYTVAPMYLLLTIAELALVVILSARIQTMPVGTARAMFLVYSVVNGLMLSSYFVIFDLSSLVLAFLSSAVYFGIMAVYGARTGRDLSGWGRKLSFALIALILCGLVGMLFGMSFGAGLLYSGVGLAVFMLLTAYDTQKLQSFYYGFCRQDDMLEKSAIYGALGLYLDFINIFLRVVQMFGRRRN